MDIRSAEHGHLPQSQTLGSRRPPSQPDGKELAHPGFWMPSDLEPKGDHSCMQYYLSLVLELKFLKRALAYITGRMNSAIGTGHEAVSVIVFCHRVALSAIFFADSAILENCFHAGLN